MRSKYEPWEANKRQIAAQMREYRTDLSEISRLFQRAVINGTAEQRAELKAILGETKDKLIRLLHRIDQD